jgi:branched-chain amino acid aminotransferase
MNQDAGASGPKYITVNGGLVPYAEARVHVLSPAFRYGLNVFEGMRAYWNEEHQQLYVFRLAEHLERLMQSMKLLRFDATFSAADLAHETLELLRANELRETGHLRLSAYLDGEGEHHVSGPVSYFIAAKARPRTPKTETGVRCRISTWTRIADNSMPPRVKCGANYVNARLARFEAKHDGYDDALMLNSAGRLSEGPGACVFLMRRGKLLTPSVTEGILESITRDTLIELARDLGIEVEERGIDRTEVYACDELMMAGSAAEVLPVVEVDGISIGTGEVGDVTRRLQNAYFESVSGRENRNKGWLSAVYDSAPASRNA